MCKVSVIVPVFNVEKYIDECLESIINQTFRDIEIILIVGNSNDSSTIKCHEWAQKDSRIVAFEEFEPGLGSARNQGVANAKGEYVVFIDSDDKIHERYIEKLYAAITNENADIAECDFFRIRAHSDIMEYNVCTRILGKRFTVPEKLQLGNVVMWKLMIKRSLFVKNDIKQPNPPGEDFCTYPLLIIYASKIVEVNEGLYFYRKDRPDNLSSLYQGENTEKILGTMEYLMQEFVKRKLFDGNKEILSIYVRRWITRYLSPALGKISNAGYLENREKFIAKYEQYFSEFPIKKVMLLGSFNLTKIINKLQVIEDPYLRINFSSIISIMSGKDLEYNITHKNKYRQYMLKREFTNEFENILSNEKPECFFFDLLEERHNILKVNNSFYTKSDAFEGAVVENMANGCIIERTSLECSILWEKACDEFFELLFKYLKPEKVFVVENYLAEEHGNGVKVQEFEDLGYIRKTNNVLRHYYSYIRNNYTKVKVINAYEVEEYYTDEHYEFGCYPWNLNEWANIRIAKKIEELEEA